ncbi:MAG: nucleoid-associated protein [Massilibacteroides sp.]|nr:nucleoid-associated protein [Massilibacteroides sp.]
MFSAIESKIKYISLHFVGNKLRDENYILSKSLTDNIENTADILINYFFNSFKSTEYFNFHHDINLSMNEVFVCISEIFNNPEILLEQSVNLAKHLYEQSTHPKIKGGEFYTVYFKNCIIDGETIDAIGLFKSENKDVFLEIDRIKDGFSIDSRKGVNVNKLDKGCLVFNKEKNNGYIVSIVDNTNKGTEAQYWIDDFLHVRPRKDEYYNTQNVLSLCKNFVKNKLPQQFEVSKADQADLINKSVKFFKEKSSFDLNEFANEVIRQKDIIESFNNFKTDYQKERDVDIVDNFQISENAVKKGIRALKNVIKLDKNFDIYIHGDRNLIEQGVDEKGKYYKVYYKEEK